ncbi:hypothetical protein D3C75_532510 [compost metagenome]
MGSLPNFGGAGSCCVNQRCTEITFADIDGIVFAVPILTQGHEPLHGNGVNFDIG